jgi:hypothetical protein
LRLSKLPPSRPTPANTSKITARAWRLSPAGPAAFSCLPPCGSRRQLPLVPAGFRRPERGGAARLASGLSRSLARC